MAWAIRLIVPIQADLRISLGFGEMNFSIHGSLGS